MIKRRLFLSNILMFVLPILMSIAVLGGLRFYYLRDSYDLGDLMDDFFDEVVKIREFSDSWSGDAADIEAYIKDFSKRSEQDYMNNITLTLYDGDASLDSIAPHGAALGTFAVHMELFGERSLVLTSAGSSFIENKLLRVRPENPALLTTALLSCLVLIIVLTNVFLTRFVFKKVISALGTLEYGVSQISDGRLEYRIEYNGTDEFSGVCDNFNAMATRLLDSVKSRQRDEESRRELIAGISHDLRTPLTALMGYVEGIENGLVSTPETAARYAGTIKNKVRDLEKMINTLFLFSRLDLGEFPWRVERVDLEKELRRVFTDLYSEYERRELDISFESETRETLWVDIDAQQIRNAMINIFENSLKYKTKERARMEICLSLDTQNRRAVIVMTDDGPGVTADSLERLFDVFYRGDTSRNSAKKGHGLGLAIAAKIARSLDGDIRAENAAQGGLSIYMEFPAQEGEQS
jgi:signal transduction histidine kinase